MGIGTSSSSSGASAPRANAYAVNRDASELRRSPARKAPASAQPGPMHVIYMLQQRTAGDSRLVDECHEVLKVILALGGHTGQFRTERAVVYCLGLSVITGQSGERVGVSALISDSAGTWTGRAPSGWVVQGGSAWARLAGPKVSGRGEGCGSAACPWPSRP